MSNHEQAEHDIERCDFEGADLIAYAILRLALATEDLAVHVKYLGDGDAADYAVPSSNDDGKAR